MAALGRRTTMHELSIIEALIEQVQRELKRAGQRGRVRRLELAIGQLSGVHADALRFAFDLVAPGTPVEGADLSIAQPRATCRCGSCGVEVEVDDLVLRCPECSSREIMIDGGRDLILQSIEVED
jgi:hydrogenase nickel incorporation protein HypA/HybF